MKAIDDFVASIDTTIHWTVSGWPMVGFLETGKPGQVEAIEPWQARELGNKLQTMAERLIRNARLVENHRAGALARPEYSEPDELQLARRKK